MSDPKCYFVEIIKAVPYGFDYNHNVKRYRITAKFVESFQRKPEIGEWIIDYKDYKQAIADGYINRRPLMVYHKMREEKHATL